MAKNFTPTPEQQQAIDSNTNMVITACPGSGKTFIIVEKIRKEIPVIKNFQGIIAITFTNKASIELQKKCKKDALDTKQSFFGTIDHFCLSEIIYPFVQHIYPSIKETLECICFTDMPEPIKKIFSNLKQPLGELSLENYKSYEEAFIQSFQNGFIMIEAVGVIANYILCNSTACQRYIKAKYVSLYIDEYQDSSQSQHQLFLNLLKLGLKAVAVGDIQQSIYEWRGGDPKYIYELIALSDVFEHHIVNINHRCHPSISNYANRLFSPNVTLLPTNQIRVFHYKFKGNQLDLANQLNTLIPKILKCKKITSLSDIAILVRNNRSLEYLTSQLNIPYRIYTDDLLSVINTKTSCLLSELLRFKFDSSFLTNDIDAFRHYENTASHLELSDMRQTIHTLRICDDNVLQKEICNVASQLIGTPIPQQEVTALTNILNSPDHLNQYKPSNKNEIQIMTLHKSKGLEFEVVLHLDLYDWVFPFRKFTGDFNTEIYPSWSQDLNLHYVGITRAKNFCFLIHSDRRLNTNSENRQGNPSQFLNLPGLCGLYKKEDQ